MGSLEAYYSTEDFTDFFRLQKLLVAFLRNPRTTIKRHTSDDILSEQKPEHSNDRKLVAFEWSWVSFVLSLPWNPIKSHGTLSSLFQIPWIQLEKQCSVGCLFFLPAFLHKLVEEEPEEEREQSETVEKAVGASKDSISSACTGQGAVEKKGKAIVVMSVLLSFASFNTFLPL